ncbi:hypothetical protein CWO07_20245 [Vibrio splendidus]|uniref:Uncharacterized protein n=2 Tax=Vibrionaceae TaxID=641 RepID=A0A2T5ER02_VIBSP|nr:hypothetical protein [Vibrio splendidus]PTP27107.1 hypothetical protein CWO07_20245 [Vibrio splendidus]
MGTWILETLLWAVVTVAVCVAIWGLYLPNILIALGVSIAVSLLLGNSWRSENLGKKTMSKTRCAPTHPTAPKLLSY